VSPRQVLSQLNLREGALTHLQDIAFGDLDVRFLVVDLLIIEPSPRPAR
jgi:hypothetical protein